MENSSPIFRQLLHFYQLMLVKSEHQGLPYYPGRRLGHDIDTLHDTVPVSIAAVEMIGVSGTVDGKINRIIRINCFGQLMPKSRSGMASIGADLECCRSQLSQQFQQIGIVNGIAMAAAQQKILYRFARIAVQESPQCVEIKIMLGKWHVEFVA